MSTGTVTRRDFIRASATGGFSLGGLLGLGLDLQAAQEEARHLKIADAKEVPSVCPYCAVGCGQLVAVRDGKIINIEGNPESPISRGTLCPKGAATYQLAVNPLRITKVWYRAPGTTEWDTSKTLDWAMNRIADLTKKTRDASFQEFWEPSATPPPSPSPTRGEGNKQEPSPTSGGRESKEGEGKKQEKKKVNNTLAIASLGGATNDNEWNYVQCKLMRALGVVGIENQARI